MADRQQPFDEEAEVCVLGAMLLDSEAVAAAMEVLTDQDFYLERHRMIYTAIAALFGRGEPVEPVTVRAELDACGWLQQAGGLAYLAELVEAVPTSANIQYHASIVRDRSTRRRMIRAGTEIVRLGHEKDGRSATELLDSAARLMHEAAANESAGLVSVKKAMMPAMALIEAAQGSQNGRTGIPTGLYDVDDMTGGWQAGNLVVIAARPGMGKTAFVSGSALATAVDEQKPVAIFSLEMSKEEIVQRMLCHLGIVDLQAMLRGRMTDHDYVRLAQAAGHLNAAPIWIDDSGTLTVMQVRAKARRLKAEQPDLGLVIVDYLQLMSGDGDDENRTQEVSAISRGLKSLAKELKVPVIALSQLSRKCEDRADKRPQLSDLRESGAIEQDADLVGFLYRPEKYFGPTDAKGNDLRGKAELIIAKQRNGPTGVVELYFRDYCARFESSERRLNVA